MSISVENDVKYFWKNGFAVLRNVFSETEIARFRQDAYATRNHSGDLLSNPLLRRVVLDERIQTAAASILEGQPVYFGDSTCLLGKDSRGYHKDNADREDKNAPDWKSRYSIIRFGVYLQDHSTHSGGLNVRIGSHETANPHDGRNAYLRTRIGDVAVWNLRTSHSGTGRLLRFPSPLQLPPNVAYRLPALLFAPMEKERVALFLSLGLSGPHLDRYVSYLKTRKYMVNCWRDSNYDQSALEAVEKSGLVLRHAWGEVKHESNLGAQELHQPLPY